MYENVREPLDGISKPSNEFSLHKKAKMGFHARLARL
jgi:hypothetical protein